MTFWTNKAVFITGASGLVGSHLTRRLIDAGADVTILLRDKLQGSPLFDFIGQVNEINGDIRNADLVSRVIHEYEIEYIFHLAAQAIVKIGEADPLTAFDTNVGGVANVLEAARTSKKVRHAIIATSDKAYGVMKYGRPYKEDDALYGINVYEATKTCADIWAQSYLKEYEIPISIARCGNIYGGGDLNWSRLVPNTIRRLMNGKSPVVWGTGNETRDFIYVSDVVDGYMALVERESLGAMNFGTGKPTTVLEVISAICERFGRPPLWEVKDKEVGEIDFQVLDVTRAAVELEWQACVPLDEGLDKTVEWYRRYFNDRS